MKIKSKHHCKSCGSPRHYLKGKFVLEIRAQKDTPAYYLNKQINTFEEAVSIRNKYMTTGVYECTIYKTDTFFNNES